MDAIFIDIKDIPGDSDIKGFEKKIEVLSFSHGVAAQVTGDVSNTNRTSGKPHHSDFSFTKYTDGASPLINQKCCEGANLGTVTVTVGRNDKGVVLPFLVFIMDNVVISNVSIGGGAGGDKPVESLSLNYSRIQWKYTSQKAEGGKEGEIVGQWNLATNEAA